MEDILLRVVLGLVSTTACEAAVKFVKDFEAHLTETVVLICMRKGRKGRYRLTEIERLLWCWRIEGIVDYTSFSAEAL